ncbi:MAG: phosphatase PAP2 family protein [Clostridia bacterium]
MYIAWLAVASSALLILLIVGSVLDLKISSAMFNEDNVFSIFFEVIAKIPALLIASCCCIILFQCACAKQQNKHWKRFLCVVYAAVGVALATYAFLDGFDLLFDKKLFALVGAFVVGALAFGGLFLLSRKARMQEYDRYKKWAVYYLLTLVVIMLVTLLLKLIWGRARFLDVKNDGASFSDWYKLVRVGGDSMPSGHTAMACCLFMLVPLTKINPKWGESAYWIRLWSATFVGLTMLARLCGGYHYLSDVTISAIVCFAIIMTSNIIFFGKKGDKLSFNQNKFWDKI